MRYIARYAVHGDFTPCDRSSDNVPSWQLNDFWCCIAGVPPVWLEELFDGLKRTTAAGGPTHHLANYTVLTNSHQGVWGGWQVGSRFFIACSAMLPMVLLDSH